MNKQIEAIGDIDRDDPAADDDAALLAYITKAMGETDEAPEDVDQTAGDDDEDFNEVVPLEKGVELLDKARDDLLKPGRQKPKAPAAEDAPDLGDQPPSEDEAADPYADIMAGVADDKRDDLRARLQERDDMLSIFAGHEEMLKRFGTTPAEHVRSLVQINDYASKNPGDYLAWAAHNLGGEKADELIRAAASRFGLKVVAEDDGDVFEDDETKALREELRTLRAKSRTIDFGPSLGGQPAPVTAEDIDKFAREVNEDGSPRRPGFLDLGAKIAGAAQAHRAQTGKPPTYEDLDRFYREAIGIQAPAPKAAAQPAAQPLKPVAGDGVKKAAASGSVERAKAASKSIDGTGQGASRQPAALSPSASIEDTLKFFMAKSGG